MTNNKQRTVKKNKENNDCWVNPYDEYKNSHIKATIWARACKNNEKAINRSGETFPVKNFTIDELAFVAGLWRIQEKFPYHITMIRDKEMVLVKKLDRVENTLFEFYQAKLVGHNCYGRFVFENDKPDYIVAKYETDTKTYWGYGKTLEDARAYLGIRVYDEYKDVINAIACKDKMKHRK